MCEYCDGRLRLSNFEVFAKVYPNGFIEMFAYGNEYYNCVDINFCPMCGEKPGDKDV